MSSRPFVSCVRPVGRLVFPVRLFHCLLVFVLISFRVASRPSSRSTSRLACSFRSFYCVSRVASRPIPVSPSLRLVVSSCRGVLLARLVFFSIRLIVLRIWIGCPAGTVVFPYQPDRYAARFLRLVLPLLARSVGALCGIRARPASSSRETMRAARRRENGETS